MSDLHLDRLFEYRSYEIPVEARNLIFAGDIGKLCDGDEYLGFLRRMCGRYERVLLVPGNHEFWHSFRGKALDTIKHFEKELGDKFVWMDKKRVDFENGETIVLGCTLYSRAPLDPVESIMDFQKIGDWNIESHNAAHERDRAWLKRQLAIIKESRPLSRVIVVTHYAPSYENTADPRHPDDDRKHFFCSDLLAEFHGWAGADQVTDFVYGHTHWNAVFTCGPITVLSNQRSHSGFETRRDRFEDYHLVYRGLNSNVKSLTLCS
jgi:predicted phosphohydrolase